MHLRVIRLWTHDWRSTMEELLYDAKTLAGIIINRDMSIRASQKFLNDIWEYEKEYLYACHRFNKKQFIYAILSASNGYTVSNVGPTAHPTIGISCGTTASR